MLRLPDEQGLNAAGVKKPAEAERRPSLKADARSFFPRQAGLPRNLTFADSLRRFGAGQWADRWWHGRQGRRCPSTAASKCSDMAVRALSALDGARMNDGNETRRHCHRRLARTRLARFAPERLGRATECDVVPV